MISSASGVFLGHVKGSSRPESWPESSRPECQLKFAVGMGGGAQLLTSEDHSVPAPSTFTWPARRVHQKYYVQAGLQSCNPLPLELGSWPWAKKHHIFLGCLMGHCVFGRTCSDTQESFCSTPKSLGKCVGNRPGTMAVPFATIPFGKCCMDGLNTRPPCNVSKPQTFKRFATSASTETNSFDWFPKGSQLGNELSYKKAFTRQAAP